MNEPVKAKKKPSGCLIAVCIFLGLGFIGGVIQLFSPPEANAPATTPAATPAKPDQQKSLKSADEAIVSTEVADKVLNVKAKLSMAWDGPMYVDVTSLLVANIGKALQKGVAEDASAPETLNLKLTMPGTDRLGKDIELEFMTVSFSVADLKGANYTNLTMGRLLNIATDVIPQSMAGRKAIAQWCLKDVNGEEAGAFCERAMR